MPDGDAMRQITSLPEPVFWLTLSGLIFLVMTLTLLFGPFRRERTDLMTAFLGFLAGMASFHLFGAAAMYWNEPILMYIGTLGAVTGSAFVLKFPLSAIINSNTRTTLFYLTLLAGWALVAWMLLNSYPMDKVMALGAIFLVVVSGAISGFYMLLQGFKINDPSSKIKCIGGGCSVVSCCFLAHIIVLTLGLTIFAKAFIVLAPIALVFSVFISRKYSRQQ